MTFSTDLQLLPAGGDTASRTLVMKTKTPFPFVLKCLCSSQAVERKRKNLDANEEQKEELQTTVVVNLYRDKDKSWGVLVFGCFVGVFLIPSTLPVSQQEIWKGKYISLHQALLTDFLRCFKSNVLGNLALNLDSPSFRFFLLIITFG